MKIIKVGYADIDGATRYVRVLNKTANGYLVEPLIIIMREDRTEYLAEPTGNWPQVISKKELASLHEENIKEG